MMTCREFESRFNELIDEEAEIAGRAQTVASAAPLPLTSDLERDLMDHAGRCPACRQVAARYQILRRSLHVWNSPPVAPADLANRILAAEADAGMTKSTAWAISGERKRERWWPLLLGYASVMAACLVGAVFLKWLAERERHKRPMQPVTSVGPADELHSVGRASLVGLADSRAVGLADSQALNLALVDATSATWDLARSASEPVARISRQMLDAATEPEYRTGDRAVPGRAADTSVTMPALRSLAPDAGAFLQEVGDRLASGVVPLSRTARRAFGFLLGPQPVESEVRDMSPVAKGAS
jgi:hypothetical protein